MKHLVTPSILVLLFGLVGPASAVTTVDFESLDQAGNDSLFVASPYQEDGFRISSTGGFRVPQQSGSSRRDSVTMWTHLANNTVTIELIGGGTFDFLSMDFGGIENTLSGSATITGHLSGGGTVAQMLNYNSDAPPDPLETFSFSGFTDLTSVTWGPSDTAGTSFDNLVFDNIMPAVAAVPEPATVVLMGLGLVGLGVAGRRKLVG